MRACGNAVRYDHICGSVAELTESIAFDGVKWECPDADGSDVFDQLAIDQNLDGVERTRDLMTYGRASPIPMLAWATASVAPIGVGKDAIDSTRRDANLPELHARRSGRAGLLWGRGMSEPELTAEELALLESDGAGASVLDQLPPLTAAATATPKRRPRRVPAEREMTSPPVPAPAPMTVEPALVLPTPNLVEPDAPLPEPEPKPIEEPLDDEPGSERRVPDHPLAQPFQCYYGDPFHDLPIQMRH